MAGGYMRTCARMRDLHPTTLQHPNPPQPTRPHLIPTSITLFRRQHQHQHQRKQQHRHQCQRRFHTWTGPPPMQVLQWDPVVEGSWYCAVLISLEPGAVPLAPHHHAQPRTHPLLTPNAVLPTSRQAPLPAARRRRCHLHSDCHHHRHAYYFHHHHHHTTAAAAQALVQYCDTDHVSCDINSQPTGQVRFR